MSKYVFVLSFEKYAAKLQKKKLNQIESKKMQKETKFLLLRAKWHKNDHRKLLVILEYVELCTLPASRRDA